MVENLDDSRFSAPVTAEHNAEYSLRFLFLARGRVSKNGLIGAGDGDDHRDCARRTGVVSLMFTGHGPVMLPSSSAIPVNSDTLTLLFRYLPEVFVATRYRGKSVFDVVSVVYWYVPTN